MDDPSSTWGLVPLLELIGVLVSLVFLGFVSLAEAALVRADRVAIRQMAEGGNIGAKRVERLLEDRQQMLGSLIICLNVAMIVIATLVTDLAIKLWGSQWIPLTTVVMLLAILVIAEITPKTYSVHSPERIAARCGGIVWSVNRFLSPVVRGLIWIARILNRRLVVPLLGGEVAVHPFSFSEEEIKELATVGQEAGELEEDEKEMIHGVIEFADKVAREVMVPRTDMVCLDSNASISDAIAIATEHGYSRIPVYEEDLDHIIGIVYAKDLLVHLREGEDDVPVRTLMRPPYIVPESKQVDAFLREMQRQRLHMAIVIDEYGGTAGLVTIEDLIEEIVGEIVDEHDLEEPEIQRLDDDSALVDARVSIDEVEDEFQVPLPEGDFDSIGGLVLDLLGRVPNVGEKIECNGLELTVEKVEEQRIEKIRVIKKGPPADAT